MRREIWDGWLSLASPSLLDEIGPVARRRALDTPATRTADVSGGDRGRVGAFLRDLRSARLCGGRWRPSWWRRDCRQRRRGVWPDEQHAAGGVVDDEACGGADAARTEVLTVTVARQDQDVHVLGGRDHLALDASVAGLASRWSPQDP